MLPEDRSNEFYFLFSKVPHMFAKGSVGEYTISLG